MKKILILSLALSLFLSCTGNLSPSDEARAFQKELNKEFTNTKTSPLPKDALKKFDGLEFFPITEKYILEAELKRTPNEKAFDILTTTHAKLRYKKYGEVVFTLDGKTHSIDVFQDLSIIQKEEFANHLFLPFTDLTSGVTTYGGGRYLDLLIPEGNKITLNFNLAYNPYCVYNPKYSCPIPPEQNTIDAEINAGIKDYHYE